MSEARGDALVFYGATGDLAFKKIFPSLQGMIRRGVLDDVPIIGVAKQGWKLEQLQARAKDSLEKHGGLDPAAFARMTGLLRYVDGDYEDPATFAELKRVLGSARRPVHYLAIPQGLFALVTQQLSRAGLASGARLVIEKPFGSDLESARALNGTLRQSFAEKDVFRIDHYLGKGTVRDVVQNHLLQIISNIAMEPIPRTTDLETTRDEKVKVLKGIPPIDPKDVVRGQFRGYRKEPGVAPDSATETFVALRLHVNSWRWQDVPFYIRAGKNLPVTRTEVVVRLRQPPTLVEGLVLPANSFRFRLSPDFVIALGAMVRAPGERFSAREVELELSKVEGKDLEPYEELLGDALAGDSFRFAREDYVEEAWRIVDPAIKAGTPIHAYEPGTWGPAEADRVAPGGWFAAKE